MLTNQTIKYNVGTLPQIDVGVGTGALPLQISMNDLGYVKLSKAYTTK